MKVRITSVLAMPRQEVWELMQQAPMLIYVCKSWVRLLSAHDLKRIQEGQTIHVSIQTYRLIKCVSYQIAVDIVDPDQCLICTSESGVGVKRLTRSIRIDQIDRISCCLSIEMEVHAGVLTPFIAAWFWVYYQLRCRHRRSIIRRSLRHRRES